MKKLLALCLSLVLLNCAYAQIKDPVTWTFSSKKIKENTYEVSMTASLQKGWHIYSQTSPDGGPVPTSISFTKNPLLTLEGPAKEVGKMEQKYEALFGVEVKQFSDKITFVHLVKVKSKAKTSLKGKIKYMTCNDSECLPPNSQPFSIALK